MGAEFGQFVLYFETGRKGEYFGPIEEEEEEEIDVRMYEVT
jgi:hypothetical protein